MLRILKYKSMKQCDKRGKKDERIIPVTQRSAFLLVDRE